MVKSNKMKKKWSYDRAVYHWISSEVGTGRERENEDGENHILETATKQTNLEIWDKKERENSQDDKADKDEKKLIKQIE